MVVTVFKKEIFDLFARKIALIITVDSAEGRIRLKLSQPAQTLPLSLDREFLFGHCDHQTCQSGPNHRCQLLVVALFLPFAYKLCSWLMNSALRHRVIGCCTSTLSHRIVLHRCLVDVIPLRWTSQWRQATITFLLFKSRDLVAVATFMTFAFERRRNSLLYASHKLFF